MGYKYSEDKSVSIGAVIGACIVVAFLFFTWLFSFPCIESETSYIPVETCISWEITHINTSGRGGQYGTMRTCREYGTEEQPVRSCKTRSDHIRLVSWFIE